MARVTWDDAPIVEEAGSLLPLFEAALSARSQAGLSRWLQGEIQTLLPHDALIAAWGDFKSGVLAYDVITRSPSLSFQDPKQQVETVMRGLFDKWLAAGQEPVLVDPAHLHPHEPAAFSLTRCALVHGVQDHRGHYDSMYLFLGPQDLATRVSRQIVRMLLPFVDTGFRQLADRGQKQAKIELSGTGFSCSSFAEGPEPEATHNGGTDSDFGEWGESGAGERGSTLSARELEIMQWVRLGKTNSEIATILSLSTFTVKNHMRRIYKKLDVLNRAQAVGNLDRLQAASQFAGR